MEDDKIIEERDLGNTSNPDAGESSAAPDSDPAPIESSSTAPDDGGPEPVPTTAPVPTEEPVEVPTEKPMPIPTEEPANEPEDTGEDAGQESTEEPEENEDEINEDDLDPTEEPLEEPEETDGTEMDYIELPNGWTYVNGILYDEDGNVVDMATFSSNDDNIEYTEYYTDEEAFKESTVQVNLYEYMILERLDIITYALCIMIGLLFINMFIRKRK